jgi:WD40 repeat protein
LGVLALTPARGQTAADPPFRLKPELVLQAGHSEHVDGVVFSPDGRLIASCGVDGTVKIWEVVTGLEIRTLVGHEGEVDNVAFSPDGRLLASGGIDSTIKLWEVSTGRRVGNLTEHRGSIWGTAFSPDGRLLASASTDKTIKLWDVATLREVRALVGHAGFVGEAIFSPDGRLVASASRDKTIKLWDVSTGREVRTLTGHAEGVRMVAFSPDGRTLASGSYDRTAKLWDVATGSELRTLAGHAGWVGGVAFSPDGGWLATGGEDKTIRLWDSKTGRQVRSWTGGTDTISYLSVSPDGRLLASGGGDRSIKLWEAATGDEVRTLGGHARDVRGVAVSTEGNWLLSGMVEGVTGKIRLWELSRGKYVKMEAATQGTLSAFVDLIGGMADRFRALGVGLPAFADRTVKMACSAGGRLLAVSAGHEIKLHDAATGRVVQSMAGHSGDVVAMAFSQDGNWLASAGRDKVVKLWEVNTGRELRTLAGCPSVFSFSADGRWLAGSGDDLNVKVWEMATGRELPPLRGHTRVVWALAFSPDSRCLASGGADNTVKLWDVAEGKATRTLVGHTSLISGLAFGGSGRWLVSGSFDGSVRLWDTVTGEQLALLSSTRKGADWVVVTPDGLFDGSEQGMQKLVSWRIGNRVYPPDRFFADYYTPGLLARIFAGERPKPTVDLANLKLPPDARITSPTGASRVRQGRAVVAVEVADFGGGIGEVRLYQNGKLVNGDTTGARTSYKFEVDLVPGENLLKAVALSKERVEGYDDSIRIVYDAPQSSKPTLHLLAVGINQYEDPSFNLGFARQDGEAIARFFEQRGTRLFGSVKTIKLFDKEATQAGIRKALDQLAERAQPDDVVLVYLAGHGVGLGQQFYFLPHEMRKELDDQAAIRKYGIPAPALSDALRRIPALKQVLILDTCQSETALPILAKAVMFRGLGLAEERATKMLARANGIYLIAAATKQQYAVEVAELGHGVLTYALLSGLGEKGPPQAPTTGEGIITMLSLLQHINQQVPELAEKYHEGNKQYPVLYNTGMDFPLLMRSP